MNYVYDITLNFNKELYNFYEWNDDDNIEFYLKIPIFKVEDETIKSFISSDFIIEKNFLNRINNKTELYGKSKVVFNKYSCIFASESKTLAVSFDEKGNSILKSNLSIDEEEDVLEFVKFIKYSLVNYKIKEKKKKEAFITRNESFKKNKIINILKNIYKNKEFSKLRYIFYEIYNEKNTDENVIYSKLINLIENNSSRSNDLYNIFYKQINEKNKV